MDEKDYDEYLTRAQFFNATGRTNDGLDGMLNRKKPLVVVPEGMEEYLNNVDGKGHNFFQFMEMCYKDVVLTGWGSVLIDMPNTSALKSKADVENAGLTPYMTYYRAEASTRWRYNTDGRSQKLKYVILREPTEVDVTGYATEIKDYYRVLEIDEKGNYKQTLYNDKLEVVFSLNPTSKNGTFKTIPFSFLSIENEPKEPLLLDLVNVNLAHYRKSADYENSLHWTGVPTPWAQGAEPQTEVINGEEVAKPLKLGGSKVVFLPSGASLNYLEFGGSGCSQLSQAMQNDEARMAVLGARIIAQQKSGVEAAETAKIHNSAENSVLASFANNISEIFTKLLKTYLEWCSGAEIEDDQVQVQINTDYDVATMSAQELTALVSLWQSGGIAKSDLFRNLKEGEIVDANRKLEEMNAEIDEEQTAKIATAMKYQEQFE